MGHFADIKIYLNFHAVWGALSSEDWSTDNSRVGQFWEGLVTPTDFGVAGTTIEH